MKAIERVVQVSYHRNGVSGLGFHAVIFEIVDDGAPLRMLATVFDQRGAVAVLEVHSLAGDVGVKSGLYPDGNSWRGDHFESELREACRAYQIELNRTLFSDSVQTAALKVACPDCAVDAGAPCLDLRSNRGLHRDRPHSTRLRKARGGWS